MTVLTDIPRGSAAVFWLRQMVDPWSCLLVAQIDVSIRREIIRCLKSYDYYEAVSNLMRIYRLTIFIRIRYSGDYDQVKSQRNSASQGDKSTEVIFAFRS